MTSQRLSISQSGVSLFLWADGKDREVDFPGLLAHLYGQIQLKRGLILLVEQEGRDFPLLFLGALTLKML